MFLKNYHCWKQNEKVEIKKKNVKLNFNTIKVISNLIALKTNKR